MYLTEDDEASLRNATNDPRQVLSHLYGIPVRWGSPRTAVGNLAENQWVTDDPARTEEPPKTPEQKLRAAVDLLVRAGRADHALEWLSTGLLESTKQNRRLRQILAQHAPHRTDAIRRLDDLSAASEALLASLPQ